MPEYIEISLENYNKISSGVEKLYDWIHVLKSYTENKSIYSNDIGCIDQVMESIVKEVELVRSCI